MWYVYKTKNTVNGKIYVGVHHSSSILTDEYLGSGKLLKMAVEKYGADKFKREILSEFKTKTEAFAEEAKIVDLNFIARVDTYNLKIGGSGSFQPKLWWQKGNVFMRKINGNGELIRMNKSDPEYSSGEYEYYRQNMVIVKDGHGNKFMVECGDSKLASGEVVPLSKGMMTGKDRNGNTLRISTSDPRVLSGEIVGFRKNCKLSTKAKEKLSSYKGDRTSRHGAKWVYNDELSQSTTVTLAELDEYLASGWKLGRKKSYKGQTLK